MEDKIIWEMYVLCLFLILVSLGIIFLLKSNSITTYAILEETQVKTEFKFEKPEKLDKQTALEALLKAEEDLVEMSEYKLTTFLIGDMMLEAKRYFVGDDFIPLEEDIEEENNSFKRSYLESLLKIGEETPKYELKRLSYYDVIRITQLIAYKKQQAYRMLDTLASMEEKEKQYRNDNLNTEKAIKLIETSKASLNEERYDEAEAYLKEVDLELDKARLEKIRSRGLVNLGKNFLSRNKWKILIFLLVMGIISIPLYKVLRKRMAEKKLSRLKSELDTLNILIKKAQEDYFINKRISEETFKIRSDKYKRKIAQINHTIPVLEAIITGEKKKKQEEKGVLVIEK